MEGKKRRVLLACCKQYLSLEDVISAPKCIKCPPSFAVDLTLGGEVMHNSGQMPSIHIPHPDPSSLARLLGHKLTKEMPEVL